MGYPNENNEEKQTLEMKKNKIRGHTWASSRKSLSAFPPPKTPNFELSP